jgi:nitrogen fixation protein FixH
MKQQKSDVSIPHGIGRPLLMCLLIFGIAGHAARVAAHSDEYFDAHASAHGGQTRMAGPLHIELVMTPTTATLYITDHADQPQATAGGKAILRVPARDLRLELTAAGDNTFRAPLSRMWQTTDVIVAFVKLATTEAQAVRFGNATHAIEPAHHEAHDHH